MEWTAELDEVAKEMWIDGASARAIGNTIGRSRNSVISRAYRRNWGSRKKTADGGRIARPKIARPKPKRTKPKPSAPKPLPIVPAAPRFYHKAPFIELAQGQCKFILDDRAPYTACGAPVAGPLPYCGFHSRICYGYSK